MKRLILALIAAVTVFGSPVFGADSPETETPPSNWALHIESEMEVPFQHVGLAMSFTAEGLIRVGGRFYLSGSALVQTGSTHHIGGGVGVHYESRDFTALARMNFVHRLARFDENALRTDLRGIWWPYAHVGAIGRFIAENFPSRWNTEGGGAWDIIVAGGVVARHDHDFFIGVIGTLRFPDVAELYRAFEPDPGLTLLVEAAIP